MTRAGVDRLDDVRRDHVVAVRPPRQHAAPIVHAQVHVRLAQHVIVDVREEPRRLTHAVRELDDIELDRMLTGRARGHAAAEADDEHVLRRGMQHHREMADLAVHAQHFGGVVRLMQSIQIQRVAAEAGGVHGDGRLDALVMPEQPLDLAVTARERRPERIGQFRRREPNNTTPARLTAIALRLFRFAGTSSRPAARYSAAQTIRLTRLPSRGSSRKPASVEPRIAPSTLTEYSVPSAVRDFARAVIGDTRRDAQADRERHAHQQRRGQDGDHAGLQGAARAPAVRVADRQQHERDDNQQARGDLDGGQPRHPVAVAAQQARGDPAAARESEQHGREHRGERVGGGRQEQHEDAEPDHFQRERREA